jgi:hypothetical protein
MSSALFSFRIHSFSALLSFIPLTSASFLYFPPIFFPLFGLILFLCSFLLLSPPFHSSQFLRIIPSFLLLFPLFHLLLFFCSVYYCIPFLYFFIWHVLSFSFVVSFKTLVEIFDCRVFPLTALFASSTAGVKIHPLGGHSNKVSLGQITWIFF